MLEMNVFYESIIQNYNLVREREREREREKVHTEIK